VQLFTNEGVATLVVEKGLVGSETVVRSRVHIERGLHLCPLDVVSRKLKQ